MTRAARRRRDERARCRRFTGAPSVFRGASCGCGRAARANSPRPPRAGRLGTLPGGTGAPDRGSVRRGRPRPGRFRSFGQASAAYSRAFHLDTLDALVSDVAADGPVVVAGHSLGGVLAALWAAWHPERVAGIALAAAPYPATDRAMPAADHRHRDQDGASRRQKLYSVLQSVWPVVSWPVRSRTFPRAVIADYLLHSLGSYWGTAESVLWDPRTAAKLAGLAQLRGTPALILAASDDRRIRSEDAGRWAALLPEADSRVVLGGHQLLLRTQFADLAVWLATLPAAAGGRPHLA